MILLVVLVVHQQSNKLHTMYETYIVCTLRTQYVCFVHSMQASYIVCTPLDYILCNWNILCTMSHNDVHTMQRALHSMLVSTQYVRCRSQYVPGYILCKTQYVVTQYVPTVHTMYPTYIVCAARDCREHALCRVHSVHYYQYQATTSSTDSESEYYQQHYTVLYCTVTLVVVILVFLLVVVHLQ